jgi:hypothetical protein
MCQTESEEAREEEENSWPFGSLTAPGFPGAKFFSTVTTEEIAFTTRPKST